MAVFKVAVVAPFNPEKQYDKCPICCVCKAVSHLGRFHFCHNCGSGSKDCRAPMKNRGPCEVVIETIDGGNREIWIRDQQVSKQT